jgi:hypothetical protein
MRAYGIWRYKLQSNALETSPSFRQTFVLSQHTVIHSGHSTCIDYL